MNARATVTDADFSPVEDPAVFIAAMASAATAVSIVTTDGLAGRFGLTVSAIASVSAEPPMVLACINRKSPLSAAIDANGIFCVNLLADDQAAIAQRFAGRPELGAPYDFDHDTWHDAATGAPVLDSAVAAFDTHLESAHDAGTHRIVIGRVVHARTSARAPLAYAARAFQSLTPLG